ncbi:hypothetical protein CROQUDRAFT_43959 [Cronartium quercuum f. sp. fusiforme G11]|uniref:Eukaryotic translation initiation factor 4E n=1 Tax=Cronartium quercuum f. sp. fusiforme G11 TaxID=708437 RepID=A0A9P6NIM0_9BASI|nr:hypothetical protein CROQUDRAFT_43959 [Cronartium quercuum f. sp. fusiforme G11]
MAPASSTTTLTTTAESSDTPLVASSNSQLPPAAALASAAAVKSALAETNQTPSIASSSVSSPLVQTDSEKDDADETSSLEEGEIRRAPAGPHDPDALVTVFSSQTDFNVKHPLYSTWTLWFDNASKNDKAKNWDELIQRVMEVESVEEFWGLYHNIVPPSLIHIGSNYYLFKEGIKPAWEDVSNQKGGKWSIQLARDKNRETIDKWWLYTMLAAIGETFETPYTANGTLPAEMAFTDEVTGVIVSSRRAFYRISIWTRSSDSKPLAENIGRHFKYGVLGVPEGKKLSFGGIQSECEFQSHADSQKRKKGGWTGKCLLLFLVSLIPSLILINTFFHVCSLITLLVIA